MEGSQKAVEGAQTGARGDGVKRCVKTKIGCEDVFWGQILSPKGVVNKYFSENSSDLRIEPLVFAILPRKKSVYTLI